MITRMNLGRDVEKRRETKNIVAPENRLEFAEVALIQIGAFVNRAVIHPADFNGQSIGLRRDDEICAQTAKFARETVAHLERHCERGGRHGDTDDERGSRQNLAARIASEGLSYQAGEHFQEWIVEAALASAERSTITSPPSTCDFTA